MSLQSVDNAAFILTVKVTIANSSVDEFLKHFREIYDKVVDVPECLFFVFGKQLDFPGLSPAPAEGEEQLKDVTVFQWSEGWSKDVEWFMKEQFTKPYYAPYLAATEPMFVKPRQAEIYTPEKGLNVFKK